MYHVTYPAHGHRDHAGRVPAGVQRHPRGCVRCRGGRVVSDHQHQEDPTTDQDWLPKPLSPAGDASCHLPQQHSQRLLHIFSVLQFCRKSCSLCTICALNLGQQNEFQLSISE